MRYLGVLATLAFLLAAAGTVLANGLDLPDGWDTEQEGSWLLGSLPGESWSQRIAVNKWGVYQTHYQFRLWTAAGDPYAPQQFDASGFMVYHHGMPGPDTTWVPSTAVSDGVDDALMWAGGSPGSAGVSDYVWVKFVQGEIDNYTDPTKTIQQYLTQEFYFDGTNWHTGVSQSQPSPGYGSGGSGYGPGAWTLSHPIPEPVTMAGLALGVGCLARYVRRRAR